ncbi:MAG: MoaD/ThiS family protein [Candidatus Melainabacteria bacterium]|nr:MAG: MoaD/ThiS family protein [Candidatus Melainabacteria bacterium]
MLVHIPSPLRSYTNGASKVEAEGASVDEMLDHLDKQFPGIKFRMIDEQSRMRQHIRIFVNKDTVETVKAPLKSSDEVRIICALSGG